MDPFAVWVLRLVVAIVSLGLWNPEQQFERVELMIRLVSHHSVEGVVPFVFVDCPFQIVGIENPDVLLVVLVVVPDRVLL